MNIIHLSKALNSIINCKKINSSLNETENSSKGTILFQSNKDPTKSRKLVFAIDMILLLARAEIYILHKLFL